MQSSKNSKKKPVSGYSGEALASLNRQIESGEFSRVYLFYGDERYLVLQNKNALIGKIAGDEGSMNLNIHSGNDLPLEQIADEVMTMPFFAEHRLVVIDDCGLFAVKSSGKGGSSDEGESDNADDTQRNSAAERKTGGRRTGVRRASVPGGASGGAPDGVSGYPGENGDDSVSGSEAQERLSRLISAIPETTVLLFVEKTADKRSKLYRSVSKYGTVVEFGHPSPDDFRKWVMGRLGREKIQFSNSAYQAFEERTGCDLAVASAELDKLVTYAMDSKEIRRADVEALVPAKIENQIFVMIDAIAAKDRTRAIDLYHDLLVLREAPMKILSLLERQYNLLLQVKSMSENGSGKEEIAEATGIRSFIVWKYQKQAGAFSEEDLRQALELLVDTDQAIKQGRMTDQIGVEMALVELGKTKAPG